MIKNVKYVLIGCASLALLGVSIWKTPKAGGEQNVEQQSAIERCTVLFTPTSTPEPNKAYTSGKVSYYDRTYCEKYNPECITASGEVFDDTAFTCACPSKYPLGTVFVVSYVGKGADIRKVEVRCNDRGNFESKGRMLDLSKASFEAIAPLSKGVIEVKVEVKND
jgi:rare lipoprotein A (peptidoglycan hydrolase)